MAMFNCSQSFPKIVKNVLPVVALVVLFGCAGGADETPAPVSTDNVDMPDLGAAGGNTPLEPTTMGEIAGEMDVAQGEPNPSEVEHNCEPSV